MGIGDAVPHKPPHLPHLPTSVNHSPDMYREKKAAISLFIFTYQEAYGVLVLFCAERPWFIGSPSPPGWGANVWRRRGEHGALWTPHFEYLRVIPTLTHYSDIVSDILFGHMACIFWHSTCHFLSDMYYHILSESIWYFFLASILTFYLANGFALTPSQSCDGMPDILPSHGRVRSNKGNKVHTWLANWCLSFQTVSILSPCQPLSMRRDFSVRLEWPWWTSGSTPGKIS